MINPTVNPCCSDHNSCGSTMPNAMQKYSWVCHLQKFSKPDQIQRLIVAAGVVFSVGIWYLLQTPATRFRFEQEVGHHLLSGEFVGSDSNQDGRLELSELTEFEATWGNYAWSKEDLEVFSWGRKMLSKTPGKTDEKNGLNLFARHINPSNFQILQIWNQATHTATHNLEKQVISGIEYSSQTPNRTLFLNPNLTVEVKPIGFKVGSKFWIGLTLLATGSLVATNKLMGDNTPHVNHPTTVENESEMFPN